MAIDEIVSGAVKWSIQKYVILLMDLAGWEVDMGCVTLQAALP
ncbi:MAG TPA: hypothetical protein VIL86_14830 [Tepidisphaeraceae bacterium]